MKLILREHNVDFILVLATVAILMAISFLCIGGMFYFKLFNVHQLPPYEKALYIDQMNRLAAPLLSLLIIALVVCIPKRVVKTKGRVWSICALVIVFIASWYMVGPKEALLMLVLLATVVQSLILILALSRPTLLHIQKSGFWIRVGSPLVHLSLLCFILDLYLYRYKDLHMALFWCTTLFATIGMFLCFWADACANLFKRVIQKS